MKISSEIFLRDICHHIYSEGDLNVVLCYSIVLNNDNGKS